MNRIVLLFIFSFSIISCTVENEIDKTTTATILNEQESQRALLNSTTNIGIYKGVFTTNDSEFRGIAEVTLPNFTNSKSILSNKPTAVITLTNGNKYIATAEYSTTVDKITTNLLFSSKELSFNLTVNEDGTDVQVTDLSFNSKGGDLLLIKHNSFAPITPITGTYVCTVCGGHPYLNTGLIQTFNVVISDATGQMASQVVFNGTVLDGVGLQDNCNPTGNFTSCDINSGDGVTNVGFDFNGQPIRWSGDHDYNNELTNPTGDCSGVNGTWSFDSLSYGVITGTFISDFSCMDIIFGEDFQTFTGSGFNPGGTLAGSLDSNIFIATGFSDGNLSYGGTRTTGDFARGASTAGVTTGGVYAFSIDGGNIAWGVQPGGSDFTDGTFEIRIENTTGNELNNFMVTYDLFANNDQNRGNSFNFSYSNDGSSFTNIDELDYTSDQTGVSPSNFVKTARGAKFNTTVLPNGFIHLRFTGDDVNGSGNRDEFALDNVVLKAN